MSKRISDEVEGDQGIVAGEEMLPVAKHGHGHKVGRGEKKSVFAEFGYMFKEIFFSDDPLRSYKDKPASRRVLLGIEALFPIVNWIRDYNLSKFKGDLIAGLTIASLAIPQVCISFAKILLQVTRPRTALLGNLPGTIIYRNVQQYPDATTLPGILIIRVDSSIYFFNSNYIRERLLRWLTDEDDKNKKLNQPRIQYLIIDLSPVIDIDTSGLNAFEDLYKSLQKRDVQVALANPGAAVIEKFHSSKFVEMIGQGRFFLTVADAVHAFASKVEEEPYYLAP